MIAAIKKLTKNSFIRSVLLVATGTAGAQAISLLFSPVITRLYGPVEFGLLGTFMAVLAVLTPISALTYPIAIVLPKSDDDARGIAKLSLLIAVMTTVILFIVVFLLGEWITELLSLQEISGFLLLIPLAIFFSALQQTIQQWLIRKEQFSITARVAVSQSLILNSLRAGVGVFYPFGAVLVMLATLDHALHAAQLWFSSNKRSQPVDRINSKTSVEKRVNIKNLAYKYRDFPIYRSPQVFINALSQSLPILVLSSLFGPVYAGYFVLSKTVIAAPTVLIGNSVSNVFYPKIVDLVNNNKSPVYFLLKTIAGVFGIALIPFLIIAFFGQEIFSFIFGVEWAVSGEYARWISVWLLFSLASQPIIALIPVIRIQGMFLLYEILFLFIKVVALLVGGYVYKSPLSMVALYSSASALSYLFLFLFVINNLKKIEKQKSL